MKVRYEGPCQGVRVPALDHRKVAAGETVDAPDDVALALVAQGWSEVKSPAKKSQATKKAATKKEQS